MTRGLVAEAPPADQAGSRAPAWWLVFTRELTDLWIGGRALNLVVIFTVLLGIISFVLASNSELSLIPPKEMIFELAKISIAAAGFIGLIIGADAISGERERSTLESLLLTPVSRRQLVVGKYLAAVSPWPVSFAISIPYWALLSQGDPALGQAIVWGALLGSLLAPGLTGLGMLVSIRSSSNKTSMFVGLGLYLLVLVPTQLPGTAQTGAMGKLLKKVSPMEASFHFLEKTLVNNRTFEELAVFLLAPGLFAVITAGLLFGYFGRGLRLETGRESRMGAWWGRLSTLAVVAVAVGLLTIPAAASQTEATAADTPLAISIDVEALTVNTGDPVTYSTVVANTGGEESPALIVAMNIINLDEEGDVVDPEDWSPERTQYAESLAPGESIDLDWRINAILEGDYMVYMTVIPEPDGPEETSQPVASQGIHLMVMPFTRLNPGGVLPFVIGIPVVLVLAMGALFWRRRRRIELGTSA